MKIASAANTLVPAYLVILSKGYSVQKDDGPGMKETWRATKNDVELIGEDPLAVLGLVAMYESRGNDWAAEDDQIVKFQEEYGL
ncbi:MAG: hypothetical protein AAF385_13775 [Pseudomonadota bacterium]